MNLSESLQDELSLDKLIEILEITVKRDNTSKVITFLAMLLAQTENSQVNIIMSQQSCTGKSYILQSIADYFPKEEILTYASASPASLIHSNEARLGYKVGNEWHYVKKGEKIPKGKHCQRVLDYSHKIIIFLDQPKPELLVKLRAFLSHDAKESNFSVVNKNSNGTMRTVETILIGFPSVFFAMVEPSIDMQESTRSIILSPEASPDKTDLALRLAVKKFAHKDEYIKDVDENESRLALKNLVKEIRASGIREIEFDEDIDEYLLAKFGRNNPRVTRDIEKVINLAKAWALLNFRNRERVNSSTIKATKADLEMAFKIYEPILVPNTTGVRPEIWEFYQDILVPAEGALAVGVIQRRYAEKYGRVIGLEDVRGYLKVLENKGLVTKEKSKEDSRIMVYSAVKQGNTP